jgi:DNA adenine methylase
MKENCPTVFPYYGGKFTLSKQLVSMLPQHDRYIEVFFGGGSMFFRKHKVRENVLNDLHDDVINLYISIAEDFDTFKHYAKNILLSRTLHETYRKEIHTEHKVIIPDVKRAAKYFFILKTAFNKTPFLPLSSVAKWNDEILDDLELSRKKLNDTFIENMDFRKLIDKYEPRQGDVWYLDPPYVAATERNDYYIHSFDWNDHIDLCDMCHKIDDSGGKFMLSYDNKATVRDMYDKFYITEIPIKYTGQLHSDEKKIELVITNFKPIKKQMSLFDDKEVS